jgi:CMP-N-acetylneuraminic acid synthetase
VAGKPLIAWTIEAALHSKHLARAIVSTDDARIAEVARRWGAEVPFVRPAHLAADDSGHLDVVIHAAHWLEQQGAGPDRILTLQPTSPLRTHHDIDAAVQLARSTGAEAVVSVCRAEYHPLLSMSLDEQGRLRPLIDAQPAYPRRQDLPAAFTLNGAIYLNSLRSLRETRTLCPSGAVPYVMPASRSLDVDTPWDLQLADLILSQGEFRRVA